MFYFIDSSECQCFFDEALVSIANGYNIDFDTALKGEYKKVLIATTLMNDEYIKVSIEDSMSLLIT